MREYELEKLRIEKSNVAVNNNPINQSCNGNYRKAQVPKLPAFKDASDNMDSYLERFAKSQKWDEGY